MKILYMMNNDKSHENIQPVGCMLCKNDNHIILKNKIIKDIGDSIKLLKESMIFNNQHISPSNMYVTGDLVFVHFARERTFISSLEY